MVWVNAEINIKGLNSKEIYILVKDKTIRLKDVSCMDTLINNTKLFYLYYRKEEPVEADDFKKLISFLKVEAKEKAKETRTKTYYLEV